MKPTHYHSLYIVFIVDYFEERIVTAIFPFVCDAHEQKQKTKTKV